MPRRYRSKSAHPRRTVRMQHRRMRRHGQWWLQREYVGQEATEVAVDRIVCCCHILLLYNFLTPSLPTGYWLHCWYPQCCDYRHCCRHLCVKVSQVEQQPLFNQLEVPVTPTIVSYCCCCWCFCVKVPQVERQPLFVKQRRHYNVKIKML